MCREKGKRRTIPTTTCKEKTNAEHANNHTRSKLRIGIPLFFCVFFFSFLNKLASKLGLFTEWVFGEFWAIIRARGMGSGKRTVINKGFVPLKEAKTTFLNYSKLFSQTYITRFLASKTREKQQTHTNVFISQWSNKLNMTKISLNNLTLRNILYIFHINKQ